LSHGKKLRHSGLRRNLAHFAKVNEIMTSYFRQPYPARAAVGVAALPRGALVEMDGVLCVQD